MSTAEESPRPDWLSDELLKKFVKDDIGASSTDDIEITNLQLHYAIPKGENYCSTITRVIVQFNIHDIENNACVINNRDKYQNGDSTTMERRYILKYVAKSEDLFLDMVEKYGVLPIEIHMYENSLPSFEKILKKAGLDTIFGGRCFFASTKHRVILMEDLAVDDYKVLDRIAGLDLEHCELALKKLARYHGASMKYYEENGYENVPEFYYGGMVKIVGDEKFRERLDPIFGRTHFRQTTIELAEKLDKKPGYEYEANVVRNLADHMHDILRDLFIVAPDNVLNVQTHGDFWVNNMMFKQSSDGKPIDLKMIDLQFCTINSAPNDLIYFLLTSPTDEIREHHYEKLLDVYYKYLVDTLKKVGYKRSIPTSQQFQEQLVKSTIIFYFVHCQVLPVVKMEKKQEKSKHTEERESFDELNQATKNSGTNPVYLKSLFTGIDMLKKIGAFEYHEKLIEKYKNNATK